MWKIFFLIFCAVIYENGADYTRKNPKEYKTYTDCYPGSISPANQIFCENRTQENYIRKEMHMQPHPKMTTAPNIPFLPFFVGYKGAPVQSSSTIHLVRNVKEMANDVAGQIADPDEIPEKHALTTFNTMVHLLKTASEEQMESLSTQLFIHLKPETDPFRYMSWIVFRDAVVQAGTGPSLISLQKWIRDKYVYGEEAAQLISTITNAAEYPTEEFMRLFYELAKNAATNNQLFVNSSSILAFSSLIKKVYVCHKSMVRRFPVYAFGKPVPQKSNTLEYVYMPYLTNKLRNVINEADSHKIQVYIRALGNTAHPKMLQSFAPYLNGEKKISNFQRLLMVSSLDAMTLVHPNLARNVLYKIYLNSGETSEIRAEAVALIMRTNPPFEMLQRMAEATNLDSSDHVNAAVKSAIDSASQMNTDDELSSNAKKVVNLLKPTNYGLHYSTNYIRSFKTDKNLGYKLRWNHIQSSGSILPSSFFVTLRPNIGGFIQRAYKYSWMTSNVDGLANLMADQILPSSSQPRFANSAWTSVNVAKTLGMVMEDRKQVEGNVYFTLHGARRFITFDNHSVEILPKLVKFASSAYRIGDTFNYTKLYNQFSLKLAFPTITGLPFVFTVEAPTLVSLIGEARLNSYPDLANGSPGKIRFPNFLNWTADFKATYSSKTESKLGFITPFNHQHYFAGYDTNTHIHIPLRVRADFELENNKIWAKLMPLYPKKYQKIAEFSTMAYTTKHDILNFSPPQLDDNTIILRSKPTNESWFSSGDHMIGFAFDVKGKFQHKPLDLLFLRDLKNHDLLSTIMFYDKMSSIGFNSYAVYFNPFKTTAKFAKIILNYADVKEFAENQASDNTLSNEAIPTVGITEHKRRVEELLKRSLEGMRGTYAQAMDVSVEFEGNTSSIFSMAGAYARSHVSQKSRYLFFFSRKPANKTQITKPLQVALDLKAKLVNVPLGNFEKAVKYDPTSAIVARLNFGEKASTGAEVVIKGQMEKSSERINYLLHQDITRQCYKEMNESNYLLQACHNVTTRANFMDHIYFRIDYQNVMNSWRKAFYNLYSLTRYFASSFISENVINQTNPSNRIEFDAVFSPELNSFNATLITPSMASKLNNVGVNKYFQPALIMHPHYTVWDRIHERVIFSGSAPRCVADNSYAVTFDNRTYPLFIGTCWHALLHFRLETKQEVLNSTSTNDKEEDVSILLRGTDGKERDVMIILGENVIRFHASSGTPLGYFVANDQKYEMSQEIVGHFEGKSGKTLVQAYKLPTGNVRIYTPEHGLIIFYDGSRVEIQAHSSYRGKIRGLCGTYDGETSTDFTTPENCILKNPLEFAATYTIADGSCQNQIKEFRRSAHESECFEHTFFPSSVITSENLKYIRNPPQIATGYNFRPKYFKKNNIRI